MCHGWCGEVRGQVSGVGSLLFPPCGSQVLNLGRQVPLPAEPSHWAMETFLQRGLEKDISHCEHGTYLESYGVTARHQRPGSIPALTVTSRIMHRPPGPPCPYLKEQGGGL